MELENRNISRSSVSNSSRVGTGGYKAGGRCQRAGTVGRNPYLNFLREFRKRNGGLTAVETIKRGAKEWKNLPKEMKLQYIEEAFYAPKKRLKEAEEEEEVETELDEGDMMLDMETGGELVEGCCPKRRRKKRGCRPKRRRPKCPKKRKRRSCRPKRKRKRCC